MEHTIYRITPARLLIATVSAFYTSICFFILFSFNIPFAVASPIFRWKAPRKIIEKFPLIAFFVGLSGTVGVGIIAQHFSTYLNWYEMALIFILWSCALCLLARAFFFLNYFPQKRTEVYSLIQKRWPDRWYAARLVRPESAVFVRFIWLESILLFSSFIMLAYPDTPNFFSSAFYVYVVLLLTSELHEELDHSDLHNNHFRPAKATKGLARFIILATGKYLRWILNPLACRQPSYYRIQHLYIHHVENNGPDDVQTTLHGDRTSFIDFCLYHARFTFSVLFGADIVVYLWKHKRRKLPQFIRGLIVWYGLLFLLAWHSIGAALIFFCTRAVGRGLWGALGSYAWHAIADTTDTDNLLATTNDIVSSQEPGSLAGLHVRHHEKSGEYWINQTYLPDDFDQSAIGSGVRGLALVEMNEFLLLKALMKKRFDYIARSMIVNDSLGYISPARIEELTKPLFPRQVTPAYALLDAKLGWLFCRCFLSRIPLKEPVSGDS